MENIGQTDKRTRSEGGERLHPDTQLGIVHLTVVDMERSLAFYEGVSGFQVQKQLGNTTSLSTGKRDLLKITEVPGAVHVPRRTGLYHFAILLPSRLDLALCLRSLVEIQVPLQGAADHLVSEALYLADPDGNGIEIYRDRPRDKWEYENGTLKMGTDPLDVQGLLAELENSTDNWQGLPKNTRLGHMHLHVARLPEAVEFYEKVLGFDLLLNYGDSAAFLSAGGYHHHIGINTWNGVGAAPPPIDSVGLRYFTILVPEQREMNELIKRLERAQVHYEERKDGIFMRDPSKNGIFVQV